MGWDIKINKSVDEVGNYTYNVNEMFMNALDKDDYTSFQDYFDGMRCEFALEDINLMIARMRDNPDYFKKFNPENGFGDYSGALEFLSMIRDSCYNHLDGFLRIE